MNKMSPSPAPVNYILRSAVYAIGFSSGFYLPLTKHSCITNFSNLSAHKSSDLINFFFSDYFRKIF